MKESLPVNAIISHYRVMSRIGAGGMGEVYLAEDSQLGRKVALKLLLAEFSEDEGRLRRFEQEARAASALNHPNIITIYEVGSENGTPFIATEFIEGETLRQLVSRGPLSLRQTLNIAIQVSNALESAHRAGIVHRDIKPENVMLRPDGYVKVLDFGIVKLTEQFTQTGRGYQSTCESAEPRNVLLVNTETNIVMGSPNYMSPEQARGLAVDARSDIFSLGTMIYEMITGKMPFEGPTVSDVVAAILERQPAPLAHYSSEASPGIEDIVSRALAKGRDDRYQTIDELRTALHRHKRRLEYDAGLEDSLGQDLPAEDTAATRHDPATAVAVREAAGGGLLTSSTGSVTQLLATLRRHIKSLMAVTLAAVGLAAMASYFWPRPAGSHPIESIAVLPFISEGGDPSTEYLWDGITENLINDLSQLPRLKVMSRNSTFRYKGRNVDARSAGRELGVHAVLTGRVIQRGDNLSISIELIDAHDDTQVWGELYNRKLSEILAAQEEIAGRISERLQVKLTGADRQRESTRHTSDGEAFQLYLKGRYYWNKRTEEGLTKGIEYFNQAIDHDPVYAAAYAGLADCYAMLTEYGSQPAPELYPRVKAAARKALEIDDTLAEAHTSLAAAYEYEWNWAEAEREYRRAVELNPNYPTAHHWYAALLSSRLRHDEALKQMRQALELDPLSLIINTSMGRVLYGARQYDQAQDQLRKTVDLDPNFAEARFHLAMVYEQERMYAESLAEFQRAVKLFDDRTMMAWVARDYALGGRRAEANRVLTELKELAKHRHISPYPLATVYAALGEKDKAFELLAKVYDERSYYVVWLNTDPVFDGMRPDPRFQSLLQRAGIAPQ